MRLERRGSSLIMFFVSAQPHLLTYLVAFIIIIDIRQVSYPQLVLCCGALLLRRPPPPLCDSVAQRKAALLLKIAAEPLFRARIMSAYTYALFRRAAVAWKCQLGAVLRVQRMARN